MSNNNVVQLVFRRDTKPGEDLIARATESIEKVLAVTTDAQTRRKLSQALIHLHEAQLNLS